ncbi:tetratricopeptide (TPR) repeat protein [Scopulibacillus daqui]|uniref:Tetratricopeptide (TPR) repeat protein n=1 Tax=Scopulibacillus daqui TaxID=1469162 RepID=A0ABS2PVR3_9BACL|nr:tetratricopeptide repeat protein [Scopulibacillus daqui]MBM7643971.1 tetratricopeptide (TPR) repeat protein [Scopulibacillus daqui]
MSFQPEVREAIILFGKKYIFTKHPAVVGLDMPYGQEGRQGTVYQLEAARGSANRYIALKVFRNRFKNKRQTEIANIIKKYAVKPGLSACRRAVIDESNHRQLIKKHEDLQYALTMPWIDGPTWSDILLDEQALSKEDCLYIACYFAFVLKQMEESQLAHCDLSSSNVMIPFLSQERTSQSFSDVELIDIEELYAPELQKPRALPGGSPGYAAKYVKEGVWNRQADRFSGAVLLGEMLTWHLEDIRKLKAEDMNVFHPDELQEKTERYRAVSKALKQTLGKGAEKLFKQAWNSSKLEECPSFSEWWAQFPKEIREKVAQQENALLEKKEKHHDQSSIKIESLLKIASAFEGIGNKEAAQKEYKHIIDSYPESKNVVEEIELMLKSAASALESEEPELKDYLEAASYFEKIGELKTAVLFYERAKQLPFLDFATKEELDIIQDNLQEKIREENKRESTEATLEKILKEQREQEQSRSDFKPLPRQPINEGPGFFEKCKTFAVKRRYMLLAAFIIILGFIVLAWGIHHSKEKKREALIAQGTAAFNDQKYDQAAHYIKKAIDQKPTQSLYTKLATIYISQGKYDEAIQYLNDLFLNDKLSKKNQEAYYLIGRSYFLMKDYKNAIKYYEKARKAKKSIYQQDVIRDLVISYANNHEYNKANERVVQLKGDSQTSKAFVENLKGELYELQGKDEEAINQYKLAVDLEGGSERYVENLVDMYLKVNKTDAVDDKTKVATYQQAISLMNDLLKNDFSNVDYLNRLGQLYYDFGSYYEDKKNPKSKNLYEQSLQSYKQIVDLGIKNQNVLLNMSILYEKLNQKGKADKNYQKVIRTYPDFGHAYFTYGLFKIEQHKYKDAAKLFEKVIDLNQNSSEVSIAKNRIKEMKDKKLLK